MEKDVSSQEHEWKTNARAITQDIKLCKEKDIFGEHFLNRKGFKFTFHLHGLLEPAVTISPTPNPFVTSKRSKACLFPSLHPL